ncbi:MAG: cytochrome c [Gammaproteobacteria bacterium]|nr:cytochrome c [Gammaproteobacteria bacterium]MDH3449060.1 cytochrome c [Gammaproteobacteria bacterium]
MIRSAWLALSLLAAVPLTAGDVIPGTRQGELVELLIQDCGSCHGLQMKGGLGPALLPASLHGKSAEYLSAVILNGRPGSAMPAWNGLLSPDEARWIAERLLQPDLP